MDADTYWIEITIRRGTEKPWTFRQQTNVSEGELVPVEVQRRWFERAAQDVFHAAANKLFDDQMPRNLVNASEGPTI